jgi:Ca2+-binding EF-hand superfamily protein
MSQRRYDTTDDINDILNGLEFFVSSEDPNLVNPKEIKDLMDKLELRDKMPFIYNLISDLCRSRKRGLTKDEFIKYLEEKLSDSESREGIRTLYDVFTDSSEPLPMTNFCRTARQLGDNEKDQELKELLENADMTGKELTFDEFYDIMKSEGGNNNRENEGSSRKNKPYSRKNYGKQENEEPSEEKNSGRYSYRNKKSPDNSMANEDNEQKNTYSYKRVKVEQTKNVKPNYVEEKHQPFEEQVEKKIVVTEIITSEKEVELPPNEARYKYLNRKEQNKEEENNADKNEGSESKRYHRRYRDSNRSNEQKNEPNVTYTRFRRRFKNNQNNQ